MILDAGQIEFLTRSLIMGVITFLVFFFVLKAMERHYSRKKILKLIRERWEWLLYGHSVLLVKNGILQLDKLNAARISVEQVHVAMRSQNITGIKQVKRMYVNPDLEFTIRVFPTLPATVRLQNDAQPVMLKEIN